MAELIPTPKKTRSLPSPESVTDQNTREAIDLLNKSIINLDYKDLTPVFLKFMQTSRFKKLFEYSVWDFINKNFVQEQMVRDVGTDEDEFNLASKKYFVLPTDIPRNRLLNIDLDLVLSGDDSVLSSGLISGFFKIIETENNKIKVVSGYNKASLVCGYVVEDNKWVAVSAEESSEITEDVYIFLQLSDKTFSTIPVSTVQSGADVSGLRLIGSVDVSTDAVGNNSLSIKQENVGVIYNNFGSEPFEIMLISETFVALKGGVFQMNDTYETIADSGSSIIATTPIYIETDGTGSPTWGIGTLNSPIDPLISQTVVGKIVFAGGKIIRIEQYIKGWFHCHVYKEC